MTNVHSEFGSGSDLGSSIDTLGQVAASLGLMMLPGNSQLNGLTIFENISSSKAIIG
jgi:hypothetical protein